jgi:hypothetical protein
MYISRIIQRNKSSKCYQGFFRGGLSKFYDLFSKPEIGTKREDLLNQELAKKIAEARIPTSITMEKSIKTIMKCSALSREEVIEYLVTTYLPVVLEDFDVSYFEDEIVDYLLTNALSLYLNSNLSFLEKNPGIKRLRNQN